eukprot:NODE_258_length_11607_cov_1.052659.p6 type:complete len:223 gc:universal NODE_258_length_11607_cov_1.052659:5435-6103(+)
MSNSSAQNGAQLSLFHPLLKEAITSIQTDPTIVVDAVIVDFDNTQYHVNYPGSGELVFSMMLNGFTYIKQFVNLSEYKTMETEANYSFTIGVKKEQLQNIPQLKMNLLGQVALHHYEKGTSIIYPTQNNFLNMQNNQVNISQYPGEFVLLKGEKERLSIVFKIVFDDGNDDGVAKLFIQELIDARKLVGLQGTPQVLYNKEIPLELKPYASGASSQATGIYF